METETWTNDVATGLRGQRSPPNDPGPGEDFAVAQLKPDAVL